MLHTATINKIRLFYLFDLNTYRLFKLYCILSQENTKIKFQYRFKLMIIKKSEIPDLIISSLKY